MNSKRQIYIPEKLILPDERIFRDYPEDALYFFHLLYRERIFKKRHRDEFHSVKFQYIRRQINFDAAGKILNALIASGIVESDKRYIIGKKAIGYRLRDDLRRSRHKRYTLTDRALLRRLNKWYAGEHTFKSDLPIHLALERNFQRLSIDSSLAIEDIERHYGKTIEGLRGIDSKKATRQRKHAIEKRNCELHAIDAWANGSTWFISDRFGRVHTPLTSLSSRLRRYISNLGNSCRSRFKRGPVSRVEWRPAGVAGRGGGHGQRA